MLTLAFASGSALTSALPSYARVGPPRITASTPPSVYGVTPNSGPAAGGVPMSIFGSGFSGTSGVTFGTIPVQGFTVGDDNHLYTKSPAGPVGTTVDIKVTTGSGTSAISLADKFTFTASGGPVVSGLDHNHGTSAGGMDLTIFGAGLQNVTSVSFGTAVVQCGNPLQPAAGTTTARRRPATSVGPQPRAAPLGGGGGPGPCTRSGDTSLMLLTPGGTAATTVDVIVTTQSGATSAVSLADKFTYDAPQAPAVNAVDPNRGSSLGGTLITLYGSGFSGATSVKFGDQVVAGCGFGPPVGPSRPAARPRAANGGGGCVFGTDTQLTISSPSGAAFAMVDVTVTTPVGTSPLNAADKFTFNMPVIPEVDALSPSQGPSGGGVPVNILGSGFSGATAVQFGSTVVSLCGGGATQTCFYAYDDTQLYIQQSPAGTVATSVHVTVTNSAGTSPPTAADLFRFIAAVKPVIYGLSPSQGPTTGSGSITIYGTGFSGVGQGGIHFGTTAASGFVQGDTMISMGTPPGTAGTVDVTVITAGGTSATGAYDKFTYVTPVAGTPVIDGIKPNIGTASGDTVVTVLGSGFTGTTAVNFSGTAASFFVQDDKHLVTHSPVGTAGSTVDVTVVTPVGTSAHVNPDRFTFVTSSAPVISFISPGTGVVNASQTTYISGSGFQNGDCTCGVTMVKFGVVPTSYQQLSDNLISASSAALSAGTVDVTVTTSSGTSAVTSVSKYTYVTGPRPVVTAVAPSSGPATGQTNVIITGSGFLGASVVAFGSTTTFGFTVQSDTLMQASSPPGTASTTPVDITVTASGGTSLTAPADQFTYTAAPAPQTPTVSAVSPNVSPAGTTIYISGSGFIQGATTVTFGTTAATNVIVDFSLHVLTATSPAQGTMPATIDVTVSTAGGTSALNAPDDQYTYGTAPPPPAAPVVQAIDPNTGPAAGGDSVTIFGTGFTNAAAVRFGAIQVFNFYAPNDTTISLQTPAGTASATPVDITVTSLAGTSATSAADRFTYTTTPQPIVYGITANRGSSSGGTSVSIYGANFTGTTAVYFGTALTPFFTNGPNAVFVTSPPSTVSATPVDVTVTTSGGTSPPSAGDKFTYVVPPIPEVDGISPHSGSSAGNTFMRILGSGFSGATAVHVGGTAIGPCGQSAVACFYNYGFNADSELDLTTPPGSAASTVDVTVTTAGGTSPATGADHYTYFTPPIPTVTAVSPSSGFSRGGTTVQVSGSGFAGATAINFGTNAVVSYDFSDTLITVLSAPGNAGSTVDVTVTTPGGTSATSAADSFTYTTTPAPVIRAVAPASGVSAGGATVYVSGDNLTAASAVTFGAASSLNVVPLADDLLLVQSPAQAVTGTPVDVRVTTPGGTSPIVAADHYTYTTTPQPAITALTSNTGPASGGNIVYIHGSGLQYVTAVNFGSSAVPAFGLSVWDDNLIQVNAPAGTPSTTPVDVTVSGAGGTSPIVAADRYTYTITPAPAVTAISPTVGASGGGSTVYITGSNLTGASAVHFGATSSNNVQPLSPGVIRTLSPAGAPSATVHVTVTTSGGTSASTAADQFTYGSTPPARPTVTAVGPNGGPPGMTVYITGTGLAGSTMVKFGTGMAGAGFVFSDTLLQVGSPSGPPGTSVDVTVTTAGGTSLTSAADKYTYPASAGPSVTIVSPASGPVGTTVYITGQGLSGTTGVKFGATAAGGFFVHSDTLAEANSPAGSGAVHITVTTSVGTSATSSADQYTYTTPAAPVITSISPTSGPGVGGTTVTVNGTGFTGALGMLFGQKGATFQLVSDTKISASSPGGIGIVDITVTTASGTSATSSADQFTYTPPGPPAPTVTSISPTSGPPAGGTTVTITGTNFTYIQSVKFGSVAVSGWSSTGSTQIQTTSPAQTAGMVDVTVTTLDGTSATSAADKFTYATPPPVPTVTSISPTGGPAAGGTVVTITGTGLTGATAVKFGAAAATGITVDSDTQIRATSPAGSGVVHVTVTTPGGTSATSSADQFTYAGPPPPVPTVTSINPTGGSTAGGTVVTITGTGFTGATAVKFGTAAATGVTVDSDAQIHATSPAGSAGVVHITVTTPGGTSAATSADQFTYSAPSQPPTVTGVTPNLGPTAGGTAVTITGTNLGGATSVHFGTVTAPITSNTDTQITVTSPSATMPGVVDVTVTTAGGTSAVSPADQFNYGDAVTTANQNQFQMAGNDGSTWKDMDPSGGLSLTISPSANSLAILTGNADLWTAKAGVNQDIGIYVAESDLATYPGHIVAWKESGGFAGTYSPNAAAVQTVFPMTVGTTYHIKLQWKTNKVTDGTIVVGAGPWPATNPTFSPTTLTARLATVSQVATAVSNNQYLKTGSDGATWVDIDSTSLATSITPAVDSLAVLSGNVDLWTAKAGVNQDVGINVTESNATTYPGNIVAWKESGGFAGTYSPNAAFVQTVFPMTANVTYHLKLQWKTNKVTDGTIVAGAGPWPSNLPVYSPTRLTVQLMPATALSAKVSNRQYQLGNSDGAHWSDIDTTSTTPLSLTVSPTANCTAIISGNADLWTTQATYNQDIAISVSPSSATGNIVAWKESGGFAGTFSPNAAFVQATVVLQANTQYTIKLQWKTNKPQSNGAVIVVGAGPWPANVPVYSPTTLTAQLFGCG
jgi:large repetitive protein